jgi:pimeloyl-ACP methyl ester carboxylesterase
MNPQTRFLDVPGGRLAYDDSGGGGPLLVCVPGVGDVRGVYRFLAPKLTAEGYRVVTMDVRGLGESTAVWPDYSASAVGGDILALVRHLDAGPAIVVGESAAAGSAVWAAAQQPRMVSAIVLCGPFVRDVPLGTVAKLGLKFVGRFPTLWVAYYGTLYPGRKPADLGAYRKALKANLREPGRMAALRAMLTASKADCEARIRDVRCVSLVVMGTADPDFPDATEEARNVAERLDADLHLLDGAGHYPPAERPDETAKAILTFLAEADQAR